MLLLYIDPGTGSMLFTIVIGLITTLLFTLREQLLKLKFFITGGKVKEVETNKLDYVIFSDSKRYWNVFKSICDEFEERKIECHYWTASADDPALSQKYEYVKCKFIGEGNKAFAKLNFMKARICLSTTPGLDVLQWKRSKDTDFYVHTYHAVDEGTGYRMFGLDFYDAVLLTGDFQERYIRILENKRNRPAKEVATVGSTYMDDMISRYRDMSEKADGANHHEFTVLLAPSWGEGSILNVYGERIIAALINTGYKIIIRPHPQSFISDAKMMNRLQQKYPENDRLLWNVDNDNFDVLYQSDIMITDFSGIIFDYTFIFDKPIIFADTHLDKAPYDAAWIDEEVWRLAILPDLGEKLAEEDIDHIKTIIDNVTDSIEYKANREKYREIAWQHKGEAAKRTVDYLIQKNEELIRED